MVFGHVVDHLVRWIEQQTSSAPGGRQGQAASAGDFFGFGDEVSANGRTQ